MSEFTVDIRVKVSADEPEQAAQICALLMSLGADMLPIKPQFIGIRPADRAPDGIDAIISAANAPKPDIQAQLAADAATQAQALQAQRNIFDGIMGDSAV
jgi:hypothetical protein